MKIVLPLPPSDNHTYGQRGKIRFMYKEAKDWKEDAYKLAKKQYKGELMAGDVKVGEIVFYLKHWRDIQGSLKLIFDVLEGIVYDNDKQVVEFGKVFRKSDKEKPRVEIVIQ